VGRANSEAEAQGEAGRRGGGLPTNGGDPPATWCGVHEILIVEEGRRKSERKARDR